MGHYGCHLDANSSPVTEKAELLIMVEAPGYNSWWQKQNGVTGVSNPIANGPSGDDDGDGLTNYSEFVAGVDPLSASSTFSCSIAPVSANSSQMQITFGPLVKGQTYTVKGTDSLTTGTWATVNIITPTAALPSTTVTVTNASGSARFYTVEIKKP